jgi:hypothetical protein
MDRPFGQLGQQDEPAQAALDQVFPIGFLLQDNDPSGLPKTPAFRWLRKRFAQTVTARTARLLYLTAFSIVSIPA